MPDRHASLGTWQPRQDDRGRSREDRPDPDQTKDPAAVALGRRGSLKGGKARAASLSPERRAEIARKAAAARWGGTKGTIRRHAFTNVSTGKFAGMRAVGELEGAIGLDPPQAHGVAMAVPGDDVGAGVDARGAKSICPNSFQASPTSKPVSSHCRLHGGPQIVEV